MFDPSTMTIPRVRHGAAGMRISKIRSQVVKQVRLVFFDRQHGDGMVEVNDLHPVDLGGPRISGVDAPRQQEGREHGLGHRDLVGFVVHAGLRERFLTVEGSKGEQVRSRLRSQIRLPE